MAYGPLFHPNFYSETIVISKRYQNGFSGVSDVLYQSFLVFIFVRGPGKM